MHCSSLFTENKFQFIIFVEPKNTMYSDLKKSTEWYGMVFSFFEMFEFKFAELQILGSMEPELQKSVVLIVCFL
jgi:hypothetical protein